MKEMWLVNVVIHAFEHLAKRSKYCGYVHVEVCTSSTEKAAPFSIFSHIDAIQGHPDYCTSAMEPVSLKLQNNIVAFQ